MTGHGNEQGRNQSFERMCGGTGTAGKAEAGEKLYAAWDHYCL